MSNPSAPPAGDIDQCLQRAYSLSGSADAQNFYDEWAGGYDADNDVAGYASPRRCVETVIKNIASSSTTTPSDKLKIFDAGCGTGLVGDALFQSSLADKFILDGVDISAGMLAVARKKGMYRDLETADLNERINKPDDTYDVVACVGTLTKGHVGPKVLGEFARITAKAGLVVATVHDEVWETAGFKTEIEELGDAGTVRIVSTDKFGILEEANTGGRMVVLRKN